MGSAAFLVAAGGFLAHAYEDALIRAGGCTGERPRPASTRRDPAAGGRAVSVRRRSQSHGRSARAIVVVAGYPRPRPAAQFSRSSSPVRRQRARRLAVVPQRVPRGVSSDATAAAPSLLDQADLAVSVRHALPVRFSLAGPNDTAEQVRSKERQLAALEHPRSGLSKWKRVADLWCAQWFAGSQAPPASAFGALSDLLLGDASTMPARTAAGCLDARRANRRGEALLSLGARVSRGLLRCSRRSPAGRRL